MPNLSPTMETGTVIAWLKKEGMLMPSCCKCTDYLATVFFSSMTIDSLCILIGLLLCLSGAGDRVEEGDALAEIETDKSTMVLDTSEEGYLAKIFISEGTKDVPIGTPLFVLVEEESSISAFADFVAPDAASTPTQSEQAKPAEPAPSPAAPPPVSSPLPTPPPPPQAAPAAPVRPAPSAVDTSKQMVAPSGGRIVASPLAKRLAAEQGINLSVSDCH